MSRIKVKNEDLYFWPRRELSGICMVLFVFSFPLIFIVLIKEIIVTIIILLLFVVGLCISLILAEPAIFNRNKNQYKLHYWSNGSISKITSISVSETHDINDTTNHYENSFIIKVYEGDKEINLGYYSSKEKALKDCENLKSYIQIT
jgi:hypothetical protein